MAIWTKEEHVPDELPPARLFLDDIKEVVGILRGSVETKNINSQFPVEDLKVKVIFSTGGKECDEVEDLPKIAKRIRELRVSVFGKGSWPETSLRFHAWFGTFWDSPGLTKGQDWETFRKLESVFRKRTRSWSAFARSLPAWLRILLWVAVVWLTPLLRFPLRRVVSHEVADWTTLAVYVAALVASALAFRHTTIVLHHSWESSPVRHYMKDKIVPIVVGAILGVGGTILGLYLKHRYWP